MKKTICAVSLALFLLCGLSCNSSKVEMTKVSPIPFMVDSTLSIKNLQDIRINGDLLYVTYDYEGGYGHQILSSYKIDFDNKKLGFNKTYFKEDDNRYSIFVPVTFWDDENNMYVAECDFPNIYKVCNDTLCKTTDALISSNASVPYKMALEARQAYYKSPDEYYFIGRQPMSGIKAVYHSDNRNDQLIVSESKKIIYDERYPSWIINHGVFSYNYTNNMGAYAFLMFPAIQIYNFANKQDKTIRIQEESFDPSTISEADMWENNPIQYKFLYTTNEYIYALYWGELSHEMDKRHGMGTAETKILKYDWTGKIRNAYVIGKRIQAFGVTADNKKIIAFDGEDFFLLNL